MEKLKMQTADMAERNIDMLGQMFPNCLTETINADGKLVRAIDFDKLRQELACEVVEGAEERYQFTWPDKRAAIRLANAPINKTLRPCREESVDFDNTENLYIEGDNLEVLKLLRENYLGKVKMIYIDPPYNTGNDFVYNDDFAQSQAEFEAQSGLFDEEGRRMADPMVQNTESNGRFHTDWLNMIYPRLKVAKDLLSDDGVIFISIDDCEVENLRKVCGEIYGERNFVAEFIWKSKLGKVGTTSTISSTHEYIVCYAKSLDDVKFSMIENVSEGRKESLRQWGIADRREDRPSMYYPITINGITVYPIKEDGTDGRWRVGQEMATDLLAKGELILTENKGKYNIHRIFPEGVSFTAYDTLLLENIGTTAKGAKLLSNLGLSKVFDYSKPIELISHFVMLTNDKDSIVLDFFSGSATTAHAVMQLNAEDEGNRKFIMVQLPEKTEEKSEAYKAGYKNICEIGKERIRRAGKKVKEDNATKEGIERLDTGFRVLKLDSSNMADVYYTPSETPVQQTLMFDSLVDNIREGRTAEDLLFQVLPECNLPLSSKIETREIHGKKVFVVEDGYLMACFDKDINEAVITAIAKEKPYYFVMCDRSIATDNVADNFDQIFNAYSKETVRRIL